MGTTVTPAVFVLGLQEVETKLAFKNFYSKMTESLLLIESDKRFGLSFCMSCFIYFPGKLICILRIHSSLGLGTEGWRED